MTKRRDFIKITSAGIGSQAFADGLTAMNYVLPELSDSGDMKVDLSRTPTY